MSIRISILVLVIFLTNFWSPAFGQSEGDLKVKIDEKNREIDRLEREIKEYQVNLGKVEAKSQTLKSEIIRVESEIKNLNFQISLTEKKISKKKLEIKDLSLKIEDAEVSLQGLKNTLSSNLRRLIEAEAISAFELLFLYGNISDFFDVLEESQKLSSSIEVNLKELNDTKNFLSEKKQEAETTRANLSLLKLEFTDKKFINNLQKNEKSNLLKLTKNEETRFQQLLSEREQQREEILDEIQRIEDELRGLIDLNKLPQAKSGILSWPIKGAVLTQDFGNTPYSKILYNGQPHNGVDIKASIGTQVFSAERGVVKEIGDTDQLGRLTSRPCLSYGKWVLIEHPNGLSTLYAHLSLIKVQKGDIIERGGLLGYSGSTGYATGPHLHFTVYDSNTVKFGSSGLPRSTCTFLPFGGYLNPLAYL